MVERNGQTPQDGKGNGKKWIPVVDVLRHIEQIEDDGGGRFAAISRRPFPRNPSGLSPRAIPYKARGTRSDGPNQIKE